ncbi:MAG: hypothetical protein ACM34K_19465 [Bacillota bacterium]
MRASFEKTIYTVPDVNPADLIEKAFEILPWSYQKISDSQYCSRTGYSWKSWAENIVINILGGNCIVVKSICAHFQLIDYGKNRQNVADFENALNQVSRFYTASSEEPSQKIDLSNDFCEKIKKLNKLFINSMLTAEEYEAKKQECISKLKSSAPENTEDFLIALIELKDENILSQKDISLIKSQINSR